MCISFSFPLSKYASDILAIRRVGEKGDANLIRKDARTGIRSCSATGEQHGKQKRVIFKEDAKVYFVDNHRTVRPASVLRRVGDFYTINIGTGEITLRGSRLFATEEEAKATIQPISVSSDTNLVGTKNADMQSYRSPYSYANDYSP